MESNRKFRAHVREIKEKIAPYVLLAPFLFWLIVFFGYAFIRTFYFSFTDYNLFAAPHWVGLKNYINLFQDPQFGRGFHNTIIFALIVTFCQTVLALLIALILNQKIRGIKFFRAAYYMPSITSSVVITIIFMWLFSRQGVVNFLLTRCKHNVLVLLTFLVLFFLFQTGFYLYEKWRRRPVAYFEGSFLLLSLILSVAITFILKTGGVIPTFGDTAPVDISWYNTRDVWPNWAGKLAFPIPLGTIMIQNVWTTAPTFMLLYLAGLQDIPGYLLEAAAVDGATKWKSIRYIVIPQLKHVTYLVVTMGLIGTLQMFDQAAVVGDQAPLDSIITIAYYAYNNAFNASGISKTGLACASAIILSLFILIIVLIQRGLLKVGGGIDEE